MYKYLYFVGRAHKYCRNENKKKSQADYFLGSNLFKLHREYENQNVSSKLMKRMF